MDNRALAENKLKIADHLLSTTYSLVKEPKLLVSIIENIYEAFDLAITSCLESDKTLKGQYGSFESRLELFRRKIITRYNLKPQMIDFIIELKNIISQHKKSSVEFRRKDNLVISDNDYNLKSLSPEDVKKKLRWAKEYISQIYDINK